MGDSQEDHTMDEGSQEPPFGDFQEALFEEKVVRSKRVTLGTIRGMIVIYNHFFAKKPGKKMSADEKKKRWNTYRQKIYQEYGRIITSKQSSERALIKRYSEPLAFLRYRLKRHQNLRVSDLSTKDRDYFLEIGGSENIEEMVLRSKNIGSVRHISRNLQAGKAAKRRRTSVPDNHNHNRVHADVGLVPLDAGVDQQAISAIHDLTGVDATKIPPKLERKSDASNAPMAAVLDQMQDSLDMFERDQLEKKKIEIAETTATKMESMNTSIEEQFLTRPHLIGAIPGVDNQEEVAWNCWLMRYQDNMFPKKTGDNDLETFVTQMVSLQSSAVAWKEFLARWKLHRILQKDDFGKVWCAMRKELNISVGSPVIQLAEMSDDDQAQEAARIAGLHDKAEL